MGDTVIGECVNVMDVLTKMTVTMTTIMAKIAAKMAVTITTIMAKKAVAKVTDLIEKTVCVQLLYYDKTIKLCY